MSGPRIVGIGLFRDEDVFVERAVRNVVGFCDELILVDHRSRDRTPEILGRLAIDHPHKIKLHRARRAGTANELLRQYVGQDVWVFGVDGDELYEPDRLSALRRRLLDRDFREWYLIKGNMLHCDGLDEAVGTARGWLAPPSRSITKLFNFAALERWEGRALEHLYGGERTFRPGYSDETIYYLRDDYDWASSIFRCLHVCFLRRSTRQPPGLAARQSVIERSGFSRTRRTVDSLRTLVGRPPESPWKHARYRQGPRVEVDDVSGFLDFRA